MFNFPTPYPDELIYSTVARAGVRLALTSPKQLLDEVFQNRKVSATVDLPCHLEKILHWLPQRLYDLNHLIDKHTLFPIYACFIPEERRQNCLHFMQGASHGALHLAVGLNASKVNIPEYLRYCIGLDCGKFRVLVAVLNMGNSSIVACNIDPSISMNSKPLV